MSEDHDLISETMETLSQLDDFMNELYQIYLKVKEQGVAQTASLGIHRNDYLLHAKNGTDAKTAKIQQVEFNTIAASFGSLSTRTSQLHRYLLSSVKGYAGGQIEMNQLPQNKAIESIANGLATAWKHYGNPDARVVMIIQPGERNAFDQRWIEYELLESHGISLMRFSLEDIYTRATLRPKDKGLIIDGYEVAVTYFRAGYGPEDYPTQKQVLSVPGRLERYVDSETANEMRESFAGLYPLDDSPEGLAAYKLALSDYEDLVMKPQREGGGHNIYGEDILKTLDQLTVKERNAFILMDLIKSPPLDNLMIREGKAITGQVVSELGIYGTYLADSGKEILNNAGGHLLRTKATTTREGGVAAGFAVIDSPLLV
ncbi:glutathione synthetase [Thamnidium elegans]|nr:glutathione synthetase [Thamnidium elegans]